MSKQEERGGRDSKQAPEQNPGETPGDSSPHDAANATSTGDNPATPGEVIAPVIESSDPVEGALTDALSKAVAAGAWEAVQALTVELRARREARSGVVSLDAARAKRRGASSGRS